MSKPVSEPRRQMDEVEADREFQWTDKPRRAKTETWRIVLGAALAGIVIFLLCWGSVYLYAKFVGW